MAADAMIGAMDPETPQGSATDGTSRKPNGNRRAAFEAEVASNKTAEARTASPNPVVGVRHLRCRRRLGPCVHGLLAVPAWTSRRGMWPFSYREHGEGLGNQAPANGWLARAKDSAGPPPGLALVGMVVALIESERAVDSDSFLAHAERALAVARRTRDPSSAVTWMTVRSLRSWPCGACSGS